MYTFVVAVCDNDDLDDWTQTLLMVLLLLRVLLLLLRLLLLLLLLLILVATDEVELFHNNDVNIRTEQNSPFGILLLEQSFDYFKNDDGATSTNSRCSLPSPLPR